MVCINLLIQEIIIFILFEKFTPFPPQNGFPSGSVVENPPANAGDVGLIPGSRRSPREGNGNPLQYSWLENPMGREDWRATVPRVAKNWTLLSNSIDFPGSSAGKESSCHAGDPGLIPGSGRSAEEGIGYPLWYFGASLAAQTGENLPAIQETWVWSLDWDDPLEKAKATHSSILAWGIPWTEEPGRLQSMGWQRVRHNWASNFH